MPLAVRSLVSDAVPSTTGKFYGYSFGWSSQAEAEREALANCNRQAGVAAGEIAVWFSDGCAALAIGSDGAWGPIGPKRRLKRPRTR
jgi:Domain of unknown function (DUF4189)